MRLMRMPVSMRRLGGSGGAKITAWPAGRVMRGAPCLDVVISQGGTSKATSRAAKESTERRFSRGLGFCRVGISIA